MASSLIVLPPGLTQRFDELAGRIRLARWLRGLSYLALTLLLIYAATYLVDRLVGLDNAGLRIGFLALVIGGASAAGFGLILPMWQRLDPRSLAALIEKHYPELAERLTSAVALTLHREAGHGAEPLVALLCADAVQHSTRLEHARVFPLRPAGRLALVAGAGLLLVCVPVLTHADYAHFTQRLFRAWFDPLVGYALEISPQDAYLAKGRPATISAALMREDPQVALPDHCFLVYREAEADARRVRMSVEGGSFSHTFERVGGDIAYHLEAGELLSATFHLKSVEPIELVQGSPVIRITPPGYVNPEVHLVSQAPAVTDFSALQYSHVRLDLRFNRPAAGVRVVLKHQAGASSAYEPIREPELRWSEDKQSAHLLLPAGECGAYGGSIILEAEHGITTHHTLPHWKVWPDDAPVFTEMPKIAVSSASVTDPEIAGRVAPHDRVPLRATVEDLVGLDRLELEWRINDGPSQFELLAKGEGRLRISGDFAVKLLGKGLKEGDRFRYRLRASDNRRLAKDAAGPNLPPSELAPHVVYEPPLKNGTDQWITLLISDQADPLAKQGIHAQRDEINRLLESVKKKLHGERTQLEKVRLAAHGQTSFPSADYLRSLAQVRSLNRDIVTDLGQLGRKALEEPTLLALAERAFDIAETEMVRGDQNLAAAEEKQMAPPKREQHLQHADQELVKALGRLEDLAKTNDRLAQDRLDHMRMERLAQIQEELTRLAKELAAQNASKNPKLADELAGLRDKQDKVAQELKELSEKSRLFKEALEKFRARQSRQVAQKAGDLAQAQRDLADARENTLLNELKSRLAELAAKQADFAERTERWGKEIKLSTPSAQAKQAAEALRSAQVRKALEEQQTAEEDLLGLAAELERGRGPRSEFAALIARQQKIRQTLDRLGREAAGLSEEKLRARLLDIYRTQKELAQAVRKLETPGNVEKARNAAAQLADEGAEFLKTRDGQAAHGQMGAALKALQQLAELLPEARPPSTKTPEEIAATRRAQQARELAREQKDLQEAVRKVLEAVLGGREGPRDDRLAKLIQSQAELALEVAKLAKGVKQGNGGQASAREKAEEAGRAAERAARQADAGAFDKAHEAGMTTAKKLHDLARDLKEKPNALPKGDPAKGALDKDALDMARRQESLNEKWQELTRDLEAQKAQQAARQKDLGKETDDLTHDLLQLAQQSGSPKAMQGAKEAAQSAMEARKAQENAAMKKGPEDGKEMSREAALKLEIAAKQAVQAAQEMGQGMKDEEQAGASTGQELKESQEQVGQAQKQLKDGPSQPAQSAMQQAAQSMQKAAQSARNQMAQGNSRSRQPGPKGQNPGSGNLDGATTTQPIPKELEKYLGKAWGELPGELRTRLVQDLRLRYGEDYAPIIQRYFQRIADVPASGPKSKE